MTQSLKTVGFCKCFLNYLQNTKMNKRWVRHIPFIPAVKAAGYRFKKMRSCVLLLSPCYYCVNDSIQLKCNVLTLLCDGRLCLYSNNHCGSQENRCAQSMIMLCSYQQCKYNCFLTVHIMGNVSKASPPRFPVLTLPWQELCHWLYRQQAEVSSKHFSKGISEWHQGALWARTVVLLSLGWGFRRSWLSSLRWERFACCTSQD